jgi:hypothetical protein
MFVFAEAVSVAFSREATLFGLITVKKNRFVTYNIIALILACESD